MKKIIGIFWFMGLALFCLSALDPVEPAPKTIFELYASSTIGYNIDLNASGIQTSIDGIQVWFEVFPDSEKGLKNDEANEWQANIWLKGLKIALKDFYSVGQFDNGNENVYSEETLIFDGVSDFHADLTYGDFAVTFGYAESGDWGALGINYSSLVSVIGGPKIDNTVLPLVAGAVQGLTSDFMTNLASIYSTKTGYILGSYSRDWLDLEARIQSTTNWWSTTAEANAYAGGFEFALRPITGLEIAGTAMGGLGHTTSNTLAGYPNPIAGGASISYTIPVGTYSIIPSAGVDLLYAGGLTYEANAAVKMTWAGFKDESTGVSLIGTRQPNWDSACMVTSGMALAANYSSVGVLNAKFSIFDKDSASSFVPYLGIQGIIDVKDILAIDAPMAYGLGLYLDYNIDDTYFPYGKIVYNSADDIDAEAGIKLKIVDHTTFILRYYRGKHYNHGGQTANFVDPLNYVEAGVIELSCYLTNL